MAQKFNACIGIRQLHAIVIEQDTCYIDVAEYVNKPFEKYKILDQYPELAGESQPIEPEGLSQARIEQLSYFKDYVSNDHKHYIHENY